METVASLGFTILGFFLGVVFVFWKEWKDGKNDRKYVIDYMKGQNKKSGDYLVSVGNEYRCTLKVREFKNPNYFNKLGMKAVDNVDLLKSIYLKSHSQFSNSEKELIENYLATNLIIRDYYVNYVRLNSEGRIKESSIQCQLLLIQIITYVEILNIFSNSVGDKKKEFNVNYISDADGGLDSLAEKHEVIYKEADVIKSILKETPKE